jgi:hypothetical protein
MHEPADASIPQAYAIHRQAASDESLRTISTAQRARWAKLKAGKK